MIKTYQEIIKYGWIVIFLYFLLLSTNALYNIPIIILCISGIFISVVSRSLHLDNKNIRSFGLMYLCIVIPMILSLPDAVSLSESLRKTLSFSLYYFIGITIILCLNNNKNRQLLLTSIFVLMLVWVIDATWQSISGFNILGYPYSAEDLGNKGRRLTGMFYPNFRIGLILATLSPLYFEFIRLQFHKYKWIVILLIPMIYVIILSGSRSSYVLLMISMFLYFIYLMSIGFLSKINRTHAIITLTLLLFSSIIIINTDKVITAERKQWIESRIYSIGNLATGDMDKITEAIPGRTAIWEGALWVVKDNWINGVGPRGFRYVVTEYIADRDGIIISERAKSSTHPHQYVLEILTETGIIGLLGYLLFLSILYRQIYIYFKNDEYRHFIPWAFPAIISTLPLNMHKSFYSNYIASLIWLTVAIAMSIDINKNKPKV